MQLKARNPGRLESDANAGLRRDVTGTSRSHYDVRNAPFARGKGGVCFRQMREGSGRTAWHTRCTAAAVTPNRPKGFEPGRHPDAERAT